MKALTKDEFIEIAGALAGSIYDFHLRFGQSGMLDVPDESDLIPVLKDRIPILVEEVGEHCRAVNKDHIADAASEAVDIAYVALGTILTLGDLSVFYSDRIIRKNNGKTLATHFVSGNGKVVEH